MNAQCHLVVWFRLCAEARVIADKSGLVFPSPTGRVLSDRVEAAYRRSDLFERRRDLMDTWADYLTPAA